MRLVRDDDLDVMPQQDLQQAESENPRNISEQPDGAIESGDDGGDESSASDVQVDLRTLEALLFSTHSPLTAGRLAELLELESTRPGKRAIREVKEQDGPADR